MSTIEGEVRGCVLALVPRPCIPLRTKFYYEASKSVFAGLKQTLNLLFFDIFGVFVQDAVVRTRVQDSCTRVQDPVPKTLFKGKSLFETLGSWDLFGENSENTSFWQGLCAAGINTNGDGTTLRASLLAQRAHRTKPMDQFQISN